MVEVSKHCKRILIEINRRRHGVKSLAQDSFHFPDIAAGITTVFAVSNFMWGKFSGRQWLRASPKYVDREQGTVDHNNATYAHAHPSSSETRICNQTAHV
jgi:hypothetical protein